MYSAANFANSNENKVRLIVVKKICPPGYNVKSFKSKLQCVAKKYSISQGQVADAFSTASSKSQEIAKITEKNKKIIEKSPKMKVSVSFLISFLQYSNSPHTIYASNTKNKFQNSELA